MESIPSRSGVYGPRVSTLEYLKAPITTLDSYELPRALDFYTINRGRPRKRNQLTSWEVTEREFQLLELKGDAVLYEELPAILSKFYPQINVHGLTRLRQVLVTNNILSHLAVLLRLDVYFKVDGQSVRCPQPQKKLADMFEAYVGALWQECHDALLHLHPGVRTDRREDLEAWLTDIFSPKVFPDVGVDGRGRLFGVNEAWDQSRLNKTPKRSNAYRRPDATFNTARIYKASAIGDGSPGFKRNTPRPKLGPRPTPTKQRTPSRLSSGEVITVEDDSMSDDEDSEDEDILVLDSMPVRGQLSPDMVARQLHPVAGHDLLTSMDLESDGSDMEIDDSFDEAPETTREEMTQNDPGSKVTESDEGNEEENEDAVELEAAAAMARKREPKLDDDDDDEPLWMHEPGRGWVCIL